MFCFRGLKTFASRGTPSEAQKPNFVWLKGERLAQGSSSEKSVSPRLRCANLSERRLRKGYPQQCIFSSECKHPCALSHCVGRFSKASLQRNPGFQHILAFKLGSALFHVCLTQTRSLLRNFLPSAVISGDTSRQDLFALIWWERSRSVPWRLLELFLGTWSNAQSLQENGWKASFRFVWTRRLIEKSTLAAALEAAQV